VNAITQLAEEWPVLEQLLLARALPQWRIRARPLRRFESARRLLRFLHAAAPAQSDQLLLALLRLAREDRLAGRFVLQAILPALRSQARRLAHDAARRDEVWELLLFFAWEAICSYPLEQRRKRVAANLVLQVLHDTTRELQRERAERQNCPPVEQLDRIQPPSDRDLTSGQPAGPDGLLAAGVGAGVIAERDAELILETRVDGVDLQALASSLCVPYATLLKRRQRAESALRRETAAQVDVRQTPPPDLTAGGTPLPAHGPSQPRPGARPRRASAPEKAARRPPPPRRLIERSR